MKTLMRRCLLGVLLLGVLPRLASAQLTTQGNLNSATCSDAIQTPQSGCIVLLFSDQGGVAIQIGSSVFSGTITFEVSVDGGTYQPLSLTPSNSTTTATSATSGGVWFGGVPGAATVRARMSSYSSGTASVNIRNAAGGGGVGSSGAGGGAVYGTLTNNNAAPTTNQVDVMPALTSATALSYTTNRSVKPWANLFGAQAVILTNSTTGAAIDISPVVDPCAVLAHTTTPVSQTTRTVVIAAVSAKKNYVCGIDIVAAAAEVFNLIEGTGTTCQTGSAAIVGSTTAANGMSFAANGGYAKGNGSGTIYWGKTANVDTCIVPSSTNRLAGSIDWVQQ